MGAYLSALPKYSPENDSNNNMDSKVSDTPVPTTKRLLAEESCDVDPLNKSRRLDHSTSSISSVSSVDSCDDEDDKDLWLLHINDLPYVVLLKIFSYMPLSTRVRKLCLVCRYWQEIMDSPSFWSSVVFKMGYKVTDEVLERLTSRNPNMTHLDISDVRNISSEAYIKTIAKCPQLKVFKTIRTCGISNEALHTIGDVLHNLTQLHIESMYQITDKELVHISEGCTQLQILSLSHCEKVTDIGVLAFLKNCQDLRDLKLRRVEKVTNRALEELVNCPNIEKLSLSECGITHEAIRAAAMCPKLKLLDVNSMKTQCLEEVRVLVRSCPLLENLNFSLSNHINDIYIDDIARRCKNLRQIYLISCDITDQGLITLGTHSKQLTHVDVAWCQRITDDGVIKFSELCKTLQYFCLTRCDKVNDATTIDLVNKYPNIHYSTMYLDCQKLIAKATAQGFLMKDPL